MLDDRRSQVLQVLIEEYIRSGEPVSSRVILEQSGLPVSSATIRNDLAKLEDYGFVYQPHTSAGRMPTTQGYRYYVDHCSPKRLRAATRARIESFFTDMHLEVSKLLEATSGLLSDLSHYPAVVIGPGLGTEIMSGIHLVPVGAGSLLVVTVGESGRVMQEMVQLDFEPDGNEIEEAESLLQNHVMGRNLADGEAATDELASAQVSDRVRKTVDHVTPVVERTAMRESEVYVGGASQLAALWENLAHVHSILGLLEREAAVRSMLGDDAVGTSVRLGTELDFDDIDIAVVSTAYGAASGDSGRVGVIGPMRMDYRRTIRLVEEIGEGLGDSLGR